MSTTNKETHQNFDSFLSQFKNSLKHAFYEIDDIEQFTQQRGFPKPVLDEIMSNNPLSVAIPSKYGGRGVKVKECLGILDASSYESLPLSLTFGINIALFLEPVAKYGQEEVKPAIFKRFLEKQNMGGLMITEPDFGSDALGMQTFNQKQGDKYHINGTKHWQGLTGMADYWLMTSRSKNDQGELGRDIDFFITDEHDPLQKIKVSELYNNIGLYPIPYGKNEVDILVPSQYKLVPESTGLKLMMDLLHRSRLQFPGMGMGFVRRMLDEAIQHCSTRFVGGKPLINLDQIKYQIAKIQSAVTVSSAMCAYSTTVSSIDNNVAGDAVEANSMKAYLTDLMHESAQTLTQLNGANGFKEESLGARGIVDSRPFQIFEGSNEMLYTQISEMVVKKMGRLKLANLAEYFEQLELTKSVSNYFKNALNFTIDIKMPQRQMVDLGRVISRVISAGYVSNLANNGFRNDLITDCLETLSHEVNSLVASFSKPLNVSPREDYNENVSWLKFC